MPIQGKASRAFSYLHRHSISYLTGAICLFLCALVLMLPSAYVLESAGPTQDVLGTLKGRQVIKVSGVPTYRDKGRLLLLTVNASGIPGYPVSNAQAMLAWADPDQVITPSEAVFPVGQSSEEYAKESEGQMTGSQDSAQQAAIRYAKKLGLNVSGIRVSMHVDNIGGPSAGMIYTLGILDMLTPKQETGGQVISGTGTIDAKGKVGPIGGIRLKMLGAKRDGARWFLAPQANCQEAAGDVPQGLRDVSISNIDQAYKAVVAIGQGKGESLPHCRQ